MKLRKQRVHVWRHGSMTPDRDGMRILLFCDPGSRFSRGRAVAVKLADDRRRPHDHHNDDAGRDRISDEPRSEDQKGVRAEKREERRIGDRITAGAPEVEIQPGKDTKRSENREKAPALNPRPEERQDQTESPKRREDSVNRWCEKGT